MELIKASLIAAAGGGKSASLQHNPTLTTNGEHQPLQGYDGFDYVTVAVPVPTEITGEFSENGEYWSPSGRVWNHVIINVEGGYETEKPLIEVTEFVGEGEIVEDVNQSEYRFRVDKHLKEGDPTREIITPAFWYTDTGEMVPNSDMQRVDAPIGQYKFISFDVTDRTTGAWSIVYEVNGNRLTFTGTNNLCCKNFGGAGATYKIKNYTS